MQKIKGQARDSTQNILNVNQNRQPLHHFQKNLSKIINWCWSDNFFTEKWFASQIASKPLKLRYCFTFRVRSMVNRSRYKASARHSFCHLDTTTVHASRIGRMLKRNCEISCHHARLFDGGDPSQKLTPKPNRQLVINSHEGDYLLCVLRALPWRTTVRPTVHFHYVLLGRSWSHGIQPKTFIAIVCIRSWIIHCWGFKIFPFNWKIGSVGERQ